MEEKHKEEIKKEDNNQNEESFFKFLFNKFINSSFFENPSKSVLFPIIYSIITLFNITIIMFIAYKVQNVGVNAFIKTFFVILMISSALMEISLLMFKAARIKKKYGKQINKHFNNEVFKFIKVFAYLLVVLIISRQIAYSNQKTMFEFINNNSGFYFIIIMIISIFLTIKIINIYYATSNKVKNNFIKSPKNRSLSMIGILIVATSTIIPLLSNVSQILDLLDKIIKSLPFK